MDYYYYKAEEEVIGPLSKNELCSLNLPDNTPVLKKFEDVWKKKIDFNDLVGLKEDDQQTKKIKPYNDNRSKHKLKNLYIIITVPVFIIAIGLYLFSAKFSINEISADNYKKLLTRSKSSILKGTNIDNFMPDRFPLTLAHEFSNSENFNQNGLKIINKRLENGNLVEITSYRTGLHYTLSFNDNALNFAWILKDGLLDNTKPNSPFINSMIENLLLNDGFIIKKTDLKSGRDILIKETEENYIVAEFYGELNNDLTLPESISFTSFFKTKYLNFLRE